MSRPLISSKVYENMHEKNLGGWGVKKYSKKLDIRGGWGLKNDPKNLTSFMYVPYVCFGDLVEPVESEDQPRGPIKPLGPELQRL